MPVAIVTHGGAAHERVVFDLQQGTAAARAAYVPPVPCVDDAGISRQVCYRDVEDAGGTGLFAEKTGMSCHPGADPQAYRRVLTSDILQALEFLNTGRADKARELLQLMIDHAPPAQNEVRDG